MIDQSWSIKRIALEAPPKTWELVFKQALPELEHISAYLDINRYYGDYYPLKQHIFNAFNLTPLHEVKVIMFDYEPQQTFLILGETDGLVPKDVGLSYSLSVNDNELTKSLKTIYRELKLEYKDFIVPQHGDLTKWAKQGVLLLHQCLTFSYQQSHTEFQFWHDFLNKILKSISEVNPHTIVVLFGRRLQCLNKIIPESFVKLDEVGDPGGYKVDTEFIGQNIFIKINEYLVKQKKKQIDWSL